MKFEEQFPELAILSDPAEVFGEREVVLCKNIQQHCLSKQRVKEAIELFRNVHGPLLIEDYVTVKDLLKELGLFDTLFGMKFKEDKTLKPNEFKLEPEE